MGRKVSKATKKFSKNKLGGVLKRKKVEKIKKNRKFKKTRKVEKEIEPPPEERKPKLQDVPTNENLDVDSFLEKGFFESLEKIDEDQESNNEESLDDPSQEGIYDEDLSEENVDDDDISEENVDEDDVSEENVDEDDVSEENVDNEDISEENMDGESNISKHEIDGKKKAIEDGANQKKETLMDHKRDLEELANDENQAEFMKYLVEEDPDLLDFDPDEDVEKDFEDSEKDESDEEKSTLTISMLEIWKKGVLGEPLNFGHLKNILEAYSIACNMGDFEKNDKNHSKASFVVKDPIVFDNILVFVLNNMEKIVSNFSGLKNNDDKQSKTENTFNPSRKAWMKLKPLLLKFWTSTLNFLDQIIEPKMTCFLLKRIEPLVQTCKNFVKIQKRMLKKTLKYWSTHSDDSVRILSFLVIRKMAIALPYPFIDSCLKGIYLTFVRHSKFYHRHTIGPIEFMSNCVVEIYGIDSISSYQHAFVYIRELASHLRNVYLSNKKNHENIYNFQFLNSVRVWAHVLCQYPQDEHMSFLFYPLIQLIQGIISLQNSSSVYPMRLHCIEMLNNLARASKTYVNCASYLLEILRNPSIFDIPKKSQDKQLNLLFTVSVKNIVGTKIFQNTIFEETVRLLVNYLAIYSHSIAFPELSYTVLNTLGKFRKRCKNTGFTNQIKTIQEKILLTSKLIQAKRAKETLCVSEISNMNNWLENESDFTTPIEKCDIELTKKYNNSLKSKISSKDDDSKRENQNQKVDQIDNKNTNSEISDQSDSELVSEMEDLLFSNSEDKSGSECDADDGDVEISSDDDKDSCSEINSEDE